MYVSIKLPSIQFLLSEYFREKHRRTMEDLSIPSAIDFSSGPATAIYRHTACGLPSLLVIQQLQTGQVRPCINYGNAEMKQNVKIQRKTEYSFTVVYPVLRTLAYLNHNNFVGTASKYDNYMVNVKFTLWRNFCDYLL